MREEYLTIKFSDTGPGISEQVQQQMSEPFFTTKSLGKGTGLGLSVSKRVVQNHGGYIRVSSKQGLGVSIIIDLPIHAEKNERSPRG